MNSTGFGTCALVTWYIYQDCTKLLRLFSTCTKLLVNRTSLVQIIVYWLLIMVHKELFVVKMLLAKHVIMVIR